MFCPKCGTKNPDNGKFCRKCGTDLGNVSSALSGDLRTGLAKMNKHERNAIRRQDPNEVYGDAIKQIVSGIGFVIISAVLFFTGVAGGKAWWWAMLFPAFGLLSKGISDYMKAKRIENRQIEFAGGDQNRLNQSNTKADLPPSQTEYIPPTRDVKYETGDLVPPSVVENTTRQLEMDSESETMTLPKKD